MTVKRFIAGATCPNCQAMDTLRLFKQRGESYRDCIRCGFEELMSFDNTQESQIPKESSVIGSDKPHS